MTGTSSEGLTYVQFTSRANTSGYFQFSKTPPGAKKNRNSAKKRKFSLFSPSTFNNCSHALANIFSEKNAVREILESCKSKLERKFPTQISCNTEICTITNYNQQKQHFEQNIKMLL